MPTCKATVILGKNDICKNCINADVCKHKANLDKDPIIGMSVEKCEYFKDKSNEIKKGLECCTGREKTFSCSGCPFESIPYCGREIMRGSLDLINRLKAENEKLVNIPPKNPMDFCGVICNYAEELIENAKSEAIKEFMDSLKAKAQNATTWTGIEPVVTISDIEDTAKALGGENNA